MHDYQATGFRRTRLTMEELTSLRQNHIIWKLCGTLQPSRSFRLVSMLTSLRHAFIMRIPQGERIVDSIQWSTSLQLPAMEELTSYKSDKIIKFGNSMDALTKQASSDSFFFINIPQARICVIPQGQEIVPAYSVW